MAAGSQNAERKRGCARTAEERRRSEVGGRFGLWRGGAVGRGSGCGAGLGARNGVSRLVLAERSVAACALPVCLRPVVANVRTRAPALRLACEIGPDPPLKLELSSAAAVAQVHSAVAPPLARAASFRRSRGSRSPFRAAAVVSRFFESRPKCPPAASSWW